MVKSKQSNTNVAMLIAGGIAFWYFILREETAVERKKRDLAEVLKPKPHESAEMSKIKHKIFVERVNPYNPRKGGSAVHFRSKNLVCLQVA